MPDATILPLSGAEVIAAKMQTDLASSVMHLFKAALISPPPSISTPLTAFTAAECDFTGYAAVTVTSVGDLVLLGTSWALIVNVRFDPTPSGVTVGNQVGGWYWVDATGNLIEFGTYDPTRPAQGPGQAIFVTAILPISAQQVQ